MGGSIWNMLFTSIHHAFGCDNFQSNMSNTHAICSSADPRMEDGEASVGDKLPSQAMHLTPGFDSYSFLRQSYQPQSMQPQFPAPNAR